MSGIAHAQRTVDEYFNLNGTVAADKGDRVAGQLSGQHCAGEPQLGGFAHALQRMQAHLRGGVQRNLRRDLMAERNHAEILHDEGVHACTGGGGDVFRGIGHFAVRDQRVQREMDGDPAHMTVAHHVGQLVQRKIPCAVPRVESVNAEVDRVRAVADGGVQGVKRPGGR